MNAASIQLKFILDNQKQVLLCGDATPQYLHKLHLYDVIQLPHHGQYNDGIEILDKLEDDSYCKEYLISDNTGSGKTSGGSRELVEYMMKENYNAPYNTLDGIVSLPIQSVSSNKNSKGVCLGVFLA